MREIKFRVWCKNRNEWEKDVCFIGLDGNIYQQRFASPVLLPVNMDNHVIMQFTGLKDRNGVEIYEGDMLKVFENGRFGGEYLAPISFVEFENNGESWSFFGFACLDVVEISHHIEVDSLFTRGFLMRKFGSCVQLSELTKDTKNSLEVIGNIYENPELLETKKSS